MTGDTDFLRRVLAGLLHGIGGLCIFFAFAFTLGTAVHAAMACLVASVIAATLAVIVGPQS